MNETRQLALNRNVTSNGVQKFDKMRGGACHLFTSFLYVMAPLEKYASMRPETFLGGFKNTEEKGKVKCGGTRDHAWVLVLPWRDSGQRGRTVHRIERGLT